MIPQPSDFTRSCGLVGVHILSFSTACVYVEATRSNFSLEAQDLLVSHAVQIQPVDLFHPPSVS